MSTKTEIQTQINTIETGVLNPATTVRDVLGTDADSLLENFYGTEVLETEATVGGILVPNVNFDYNVKIIKQGRKVAITGVCENVSSIFSNVIFSIDGSNPEYKPSTNTFDTRFGASVLAYGNGTFLNNEQAFVYLYLSVGVYSVFHTILAPTEKSYFTITYNTEA